MSNPFEILVLMAPLANQAHLEEMKYEDALTRQHWNGIATTAMGEPWELLVFDWPAKAAQPQPITGSGITAWHGLSIGANSGPSPDGAGALLCNFMNISPEHEEEFNAWYDTEHIPRLSTVPGVLSARRYRAVAETPAYLAIYHVAQRSTLESAAWKSAARTPWNERIRQLQFGHLRLVMEPAHSGV